MKKEKLDLEKFPKIKEFVNALERIDIDLSKYRAIREKLNKKIKAAESLRAEYSAKKRHLTMTVRDYMVEVNENFDTLVKEAEAIKGSNEVIKNALDSDMMKEVDTNYDSKMIIYMGLKDILKPEKKSELKVVK